jgi:prepilin-type N-terminal cleavage/methylation domain-containing protein
MRNKKGFTIIELLVAMSILAVVLLGLLAGFIKIKRQNLSNIFRDEAASIAQETFEEYRNDNITTLLNTFQDTVCDPTDNTSHRVFRQIGNVLVPFGRKLELTSSATGNIAPVKVTICWYEHTVFKTKAFESIIKGK